jgi:cytochrome bd-type quinol oxidase subunit 2
MIRRVNFSLLQLDPRRKIVVIPNQLEFTVHNESSSANLLKVILSQSTLLYDTIISYHFFNYNIFLKFFNLILEL